MFKKSGLNRFPLKRINTFFKNPIGVNRFTAGVYLYGRLGESKVFPCINLPRFFTIIPFAKEGSTRSYWIIFIAAIINNDVNTTPIFLPLLDNFCRRWRFCSSISCFKRMPCWIKSSKSYKFFWFSYTFLRLSCGFSCFSQKIWSFTKRKSNSLLWRRNCCY